MEKEVMRGRRYFFPSFPPPPPYQLLNLSDKEARFSSTALEAGGTHSYYSRHLIRTILIPRLPKAPV